MKTSLHKRKETITTTYTTQASEEVSDQGALGPEGLVLYEVLEVRI